MIFNWYKIINRAEFEATGLVSRELNLILDQVGAVTIMVTKGKLYSLIYKGVILSVGVTNKNPFVFEDLAVFLAPNDDIWLGIKVNES